MRRKIHKRILLEQRLRRLPQAGWSWVDRRFLSDEHAAGLGRDALLLYFFLTAVADKHGLSYYGDRGIASRLRMSQEAISQARRELCRSDLVAFDPPLYQVLSLPERRERLRRGAPASLAEVLSEIARRGRGEAAALRTEGETRS